MEIEGKKLNGWSLKSFKELGTVGWQPKRDFDLPITALSGSKSHTHFTIYQSTQDLLLASDIMPAFLSTQHQLVHIYGFPQSFNANPGQRSRSSSVRVFALQPVVLPPT